MTAPRLSACVIACNEELDLSRCLASVSFADEVVVVVDDRSTDATEKIAREAGARVELHPYHGNVEQKNVALDLTTGDWVLSLDADEAVTPELAEQVRATLARPDPGAVGFELNRITWHLGRWIRHGEFYPDWQLRLFRHSAGRWEGENPHGRVEVDGPVARLAGDLEHYSYRDLADQVDRIQDFSRIQAGGYRQAGRPVRVVADLVFRPPLRFLRAYLVKQGFRDGVPGFIIAAATAFHVFLKYAKLWESEHLGTSEGRVSGKPGRD